VRATPGKACAGGRRRARAQTRVQLGFIREEGDDTRSHLSVVAGAGERGDGLAVVCWVGWAELRCWVAARKKVKRAGDASEPGHGERAAAADSS
jgi:hypothetical protein